MPSAAVTSASTTGQAMLMTRNRPSASARRNAGLTASARKARSSGEPALCVFIGLAVHLRGRRRGRTRAATARGDQGADMGTRIGLIGGAGKLEAMMACFFLRHAELTDRCPVLDAGEVVPRRERSSPDLSLKWTVTVISRQRCRWAFTPARPALLARGQIVANRLGLVFDEQNGVSA